jgi:hypothetical protein
MVVDMVHDHHRPHTEHDFVDVTNVLLLPQRRRMMMTTVVVRNVSYPWV